MPIRVFGLTGGLASGKSTVGARFRALGLPVIDADQVAREVVAPGTEGLAAVVAAFGPAILDASGALDRAALAALVFSDDAKRRQLNALLHPRIGNRTLELADAHAARGERLACYEATLLVENGLADAFRPLVVVAAPETAQVARAMARDGVTADQALARIRAQLPLADKIAKADYVIHNDADRATLESRADAVLADIRQRTG